MEANIEICSVDMKFGQVYQRRHIARFAKHVGACALIVIVETVVCDVMRIATDNGRLCLQHATAAVRISRESWFADTIDCITRNKASSVCGT